MSRLAKDASPEAKVYGEWAEDYWSHDPTRSPRQHMAVVDDEWKSTCACTGCPECAPDLLAMIEQSGLRHWRWKPAERWADATCPGCDVLICEQPRLGLWVWGTSGFERCGACLPGELTDA